MENYSTRHRLIALYLARLREILTPGEQRMYFSRKTENLPADLRQHLEDDPELQRILDELRHAR